MRLGLNSVGLNQSNVFSPLSLFQNGEQGALYDVSDFNNYMVTGVELATVTSQAGVAAGGPAFTNYTVGPSPEIGKWYRIRATVSGYSGTGDVGVAGSTSRWETTPVGNGGTISADGNLDCVVKAISVSQVQFYTRSTNTANFSNISIKEVTGISNATMYQDSAGTTPVTAVGQPVGLLLDKRLGAVRGAELVTGAYVTAGAAYWTNNSGTLTLNAPDAAAAYIDDTGSYPQLVAGGWYEVAFNYTHTSGSAPQLILKGTTQTFSSTSGPKRFIMQAGSSTAGYGARFGSFAACQASVSGLTVKALPGNHATQATAASRPTLQQDASGFYYLSFDGVDDSLATGSIDFSATDKMTVFAGVHRAATGIVAELSASTDTNAGSFHLYANTSSWQSLLRGSIGNNSYNTATVAAPVSNVLSASFDLAATVQAQENIPRVNGAVDQSFAGGGESGVGPFGNYPLYIGRRGGSSLPFNGRLVYLAIRGAATNSTQITQMERVVGSKMGINI